MKIVDIEGIGLVHAQKLGKAGIRNTSALLEKGATRSERRELARTTGISEALILQWVNRADLMRVKGIGQEYLGLLENVGVDTLDELANRDVDGLLQAMEKVNSSRKLVGKLPARRQVLEWTRQVSGPMHSLPGDGSTDAPPPTGGRKLPKIVEY